MSKVEQEQDTETLLALLSSLLQPPIPSQDVLLDALIDRQGDVESAAKYLGLPASMAATTSQSSHLNFKKRAAQGRLDEWLNGPSLDSANHKKRKSETSPNEPTPSTSSKTLEATETHQLRSLTPKPPSTSRETSTFDLSSLPSFSRLPPLTLSDPDLVKKHTPCTLHLRVLPPELACRLFYTMVDASKGWKTSKWFLVDRVVESPHKAFFYARTNNGIDDNTEWQNLSQYWYNGQTTGPPPVFPSEMEEACRIIEDVVNVELRKRQRHPLEWGGAALDGHSWKANVAVSNCYIGSKSSVGFHSDQMTYLGPMPTIASLSLGTSRIFRLREVIPRSEKGERQAQTFNIPVVHNSLVIMHASTQERFKHTIPPQKTIDIFHPPFPPHINMDTIASDVGRCRINITFRFYRPDFRPETTPICKCNVPCILRADLKGRVEGQEQRYFWMCYAGLQNEGKGCSFVKVLDYKAEGRGPFIGDQQAGMDIITNNDDNKCAGK